MAIEIASIAGQIGGIVESKAAGIGGATYTKIKAALEQHAQAYGGTLANIASALKDKKIGVAEAAEAVRAANLVYAISIHSQVELILLSAIQQFLNQVIEAGRSLINAALPIPLL